MYILIIIAIHNGMIGSLHHVDMPDYESCRALKFHVEQLHADLKATCFEVKLE